MSYQQTVHLFAHTHNCGALESELVFVYDVYCKPLQSGWEYNLVPRLISSFHTREEALVQARLDGRASQTISDINSTSATGAQIHHVVVNA